MDNIEYVVIWLGIACLLFMFLFGWIYLDYKRDVKFIENGYTITTIPGCSDSQWVKQ